MPTSPNSRAGGSDPLKNGENSGAASNSSAEQTGQSRSSRRLQRQNLMQRFSRLREDAQLAGLIQTTPVEAVKSGERVKTADQTTQPQPKLIERAIKSGWAVPEDIKPELVAELTAIVIDDSEESSDKTKVAAFRALLAADQSQHDRDNPQKTAKGGVVNVSVQTNIAAVDIIRAKLKKVIAQVIPPQITEE